jgi:hypothetical protein
MKTTLYWASTAILVIFIGSGGVAYLFAADFTAAGFAVLGLPIYLMQMIGLGKVVGALVIAVPGLPRVKEWAYAGILIDVTGAIWAHVAMDDYGVYAYHIVSNLVFVALVVVSWWLRPPARIMGTAAQF